MKGGRFRRVIDRGRRRRGPSTIRFQAQLPAQSWPKAVSLSDLNFSQMRELMVATAYRSGGTWCKLTSFGGFVCYWRHKSPPGRDAVWCWAPKGVSMNDPAELRRGCDPVRRMAAFVSFACHAAINSTIRRANELRNARLAEAVAR